MTFERHDIAYVLDTRLSGQDGEMSLLSQLIELPAVKSSGRSASAWNSRPRASKTGYFPAHRAVRSEPDRAPRNDAVAFRGKTNGVSPLSHGTPISQPSDAAELARARKELIASLEESQNFALALSSIARTYSKEWLLTARGDVELLKAAEKYAMQAVAARHNMADGYRDLGVAKVLQGAIDESVEALELAETLSPHYADVIADHADTLAALVASGPRLAQDRARHRAEPFEPGLLISGPPQEP